MARTRDNRLAVQMVQLVVNNGGEILSDGQILEELALAFVTDTETINKELVYLRQKGAVMLDRHGDGKFYGVYLLPSWKQAMEAMCPGLKVTEAPPPREVDVTERTMTEPKEDDIDYAKLAMHMLEQAGAAMDKSRKADEIMMRNKELISENIQLSHSNETLRSENSRLSRDRDTLLKEIKNESNDDAMTRALTVGLEAAKEEVKRLRNELIAKENEARSLEQANQSLRRELNKAKSQTSGGPVWQRLRPESQEALDKLKRDLRNE